MTLTLRYMHPDDISQVVEIDKVSFSTPWSAQSYAYEVKESNYSHMVALENRSQQPVQGWRRLIHLGNANRMTEKHELVGYGGLWRIVDEAHISTIATAPTWRGKGFGEVLLVAMVKRSLVLGAAYIVLEVRVSNTIAQNLYRKYDFEIVDTKTNYYRDDGEDAYDMRLDLTESGLHERIDSRLNALQVRHRFTDHYTNASQISS
jgi:ribosomal-protein-alanine N-acetyltransferase